MYTYWAKLSQKRMGAYSIILLQTLFSTWSWLFLLFAAFSLASIHSGGLISAILFLCNAAIRTFCGQFLSKLSQRFQEQQRLYLSLAARILFLFSLLLLPMVAQYPNALIVWFLWVNIILVWDNYLCFHLKYYFNDANHISLTRFNTLNNLGARGVIAIASVIAIQIGQNQWHTLTAICLMLALTGIVAAYQAICYAKSHHTNDNAIRSSVSPILSDASNQATIARLAAILLFLMNLFFGAGVLIFTIATVKYQLITAHSLNLVTFFYFGFITVNIAGTFFDKQFSKWINWKNLIATYYLTALIGASLFIFRHQPGWCFSMTVLWGIVYGFSTTAFFTLLTNQIRGHNQAALFAKVDSASRLGFILSQLITGLLINTIIKPLQLLQFYSLCSILTLFVILFLYRNQLNRVTTYEHSTM